MMKTTLVPFLCVLASALAAACGGAPGRADGDPEPECRLPDTLRVGTLYSPTSFFIYRGDSLGYDYDLACRFAEDSRRPVSFTVGRSLGELVELARSGRIDLIAYEVPVTAEYAEHLLPCGYENVTTQVLIQRTDNPDSLITDVTQLVGRDVYVEAGSKYYYRMLNLNAELGGGVNVIPVASDTIVTEDLIDMVSAGGLPLTVADSDVAALNGTYYANLDFTVGVSLEQRAAWAVDPSRRCLADSIDSWMTQAEPVKAQKELLKRYFQLAKIAGNPYTNIDFTDGTISKYDNIFRRYAGHIGWDWRMLAAQAYTESRFNPRARSFAGARGLMQIMPRTGRAYGLRNANDPEQSVRAAVSLLADLDRLLEPKVPDPTERLKFVLAAYNGGIGHVFDAIRLAEKHGLDPQLWDGNVAEAALMLANPVYYNDNVVKYGYLRGRETTDYVDRILRFYDVGKTAIPV